MRNLPRLTLWGITAALTLSVALLAARSDVGGERAAMIFASLRPAANHAKTFDAEAANRQLVTAVQALAEDRNRLAARLAAVEGHLDDVTGSVSREIEAAKAKPAEAAPPPWPDEVPLTVSTPATIAALVAAATPAPAAEPPASDNAAAAAALPLYGVDLGGALSIQALHGRWAGIRSAHPQLFAGLQPIVTLRDGPSPNRTELRLVVGPFRTTEAAQQLCASLAAFKLFCLPTSFNGQHLALQ
jgi:hypothetical protein